MSRSLSVGARQAAYAQSSDKAWILLVTIDHPSFTAPIRVASDPKELLPVAQRRGVISRGDEFIFLPFNISLPQQDDSGNARAKVSIDNIDRRIVESVRQANSALSITLELVLSSSPDTVEVSAPNFRLEAVTYNAFTVEGDLTMEYFDLEPFPKNRFTPADFPGLF